MRLKSTLWVILAAAVRDKQRRARPRSDGESNRVDVLSSWVYPRRTASSFCTNWAWRSSNSATNGNSPRRPSTSRTGSGSSARWRTASRGGRWRRRTSSHSGTYRRSEMRRWDSCTLVTGRCCVRHTPAALPSSTEAAAPQPGVVLGVASRRPTVKGTWITSFRLADPGQIRLIMWCWPVPPAIL